jgi:protein TonB
VNRIFRNVCQILIFLFVQTASGQTDTLLAGDTVARDSNRIYEFSEIMPEFPGGSDALITYITVNRKIPADMEVYGTVYVSFVIEKDGSISTIGIMRGIPGCEYCSKEAIRLVKGMPKWSPGKFMGKPVRSRYRIPVKFKSS